MKKIIKLFLITILFFLSINFYVILTTKNNIITIDNISSNDYDCILILGASIRGNDPSPMLKDRLQTGITLYNNQISNKILVSGDHTKDDYDEVNVMKNYLKEHEIPSKNIFMDHAGVSTYDSIYRAKKIFKAKKIVIVTQEYHLYRALYIAKRLDVTAVGVPANKNLYVGQSKREFREILARIKDAFKCLIKPESNFLGEVFPINGNGDSTNNQEYSN